MAKAPTTDAERKIILRAFDVARSTLADMAAVLGVSVSMVEKWRSGARPMPEAAQHQLALYLRTQADSLLEAANAIDGIHEYRRASRGR